MSGIISNFGSDNWIPALSDLCFNFLRNMQNREGGRFLRFSDAVGTIENPGEIVREYHRTAIKLKLHIFGDNAKDCYIDYHKIAALYIRAFLKIRPFSIDKPKETKNPAISMYAKSANEYFVIPYLSLMFKGWNKNHEGVLRLEQGYRDNFIMLLHQYGKDISKCDPVSFSNTIYLIEQNYFKYDVL